MFKEFKEFISRGSVLDLAIGVIIGAAFGKIVTSFVDDIIMPPIGMLMGKVDFSKLKLVLQPGDDKTEVALRYGSFLNNVITFLIVAAAVFMVVKAANRMRRKEAEAPSEPTTKPCPMCLSEVPLGAKRCAHCTSELA